MSITLPTIIASISFNAFKAYHKANTDLSVYAINKVNTRVKDEDALTFLFYSRVYSNKIGDMVARCDTWAEWVPLLTAPVSSDLLHAHNKMYESGTRIGVRIGSYIKQLTK